MIRFKPKKKDFDGEPDIVFQSVKMVESSKYWFVFEDDFIKMIPKSSFILG